MSMFMFLEADALDASIRTFGHGTRHETGAGDYLTESLRHDHGNKAAIRRPYRGIQIKDDTYATLSIMNSNGEAVPLTSSSSTKGGRSTDVSAYGDFILQQISDERQEKQQIIETFGDSFIFFFGEKPRIVTFSGLLVNTEDFNWRASFWYNYDKSLRGTKLAERGARAVLAYDSMVLGGYPISASAREDASRPYEVQFSMTMFITNYEDYSAISTKFPGQKLPDLDALNRQLEQTEVPVSSTAAVRQAAIDAYTSRGLTGMMGDALRAGSDVLGMVGAANNALHTMMSGRVVRTPIGIAGFLSGVGEATVAAGSTTPLMLQQMKALGSVKIKVSGRSYYTKYDKNTYRTDIYKNYDEYPLSTQVPDIPAWATTELLQRKGRLAFQREKKKATLLAASVAAAAEAKAKGVIADLINFTKFGFAMANNIDAVIDDPGPAMANILGLSGIEAGLQRDSTEDE